MQKEQMDLQIRYWNDENNIVKTNYYDSQFFSRPNKDNIYHAINTSTKDLPTDQMIHLSMDGPNTNCAVLDKFKESREENENPTLAEIGSCSLHIISGSLNAGVTESGWEIDKVMKSMWRLLSDSPARREIYFQQSKSGKVPLQFSATRWVENEDTAERACLVWPDIVLVINHFSTKSKSNQPKNKSYERLTQCVNDKLIPLKLLFFKEIAGILNNFLRPFQTENPMVPFLSDAYEDLLRKLMKMFLLRSHVDAAQTPRALIKVDVKKKDVQLPLNQLRLPTSVKAAISSSSCSADKKDRFRKDCVSFLIGVIEKLKEQLPITSLIVRASSCLSPENLLNQELSILNFERLVDKIYKLKYISATEADAAKLEFQSFIVYAKKSCEKFEKFNKFHDRLDLFHGQFVIPKKDEYKNFWKICIFVFTLSHGQSHVERGFNINKNTLKDNMQSTSLIGRRIVYDTIKASGKGPWDFPLTNALILSCKQAHSRYVTELKNNKTEESSKKDSSKCKAVYDEINEAKRQKLSLESCIVQMEKDADDYFTKAEETENQEFLKTGNKLRRAIKENGEKIKKLDSDISKLESKLKHCT